MKLEDFIEGLSEEVARVHRRLFLDRMIYGRCFYRVTADGHVERVDPRMVVDEDDGSIVEFKP